MKFSPGLRTTQLPEGTKAHEKSQLPQQTWHWGGGHWLPVMNDLGSIWKYVSGTNQTPKCDLLSMTKEENETVEWFIAVCKRDSLYIAINSSSQLKEHTHTTM